MTEYLAREGETRNLSYEDVDPNTCGQGAIASDELRAVSRLSELALAYGWMGEWATWMKNMYQWNWRSMRTS